MRTRSEKLLIKLIENSLSVIRENKMWKLLDSAVIVEQFYLMKNNWYKHKKINQHSQAAGTNMCVTILKFVTLRKISNNLNIGGNRGTIILVIKSVHLMLQLDHKLVLILSL